MTTREFIPEERHETIRQLILKLLSDREMTIRELSQEIGKSERELYDHLDNLRKHKSINIIPAECVKCGFIFKNRERAKKPGKCPKCKSTHIEHPMFSYT